MSLKNQVNPHRLLVEFEKEVKAMAEQLKVQEELSQPE